MGEAYIYIKLACLEFFASNTFYIQSPIFIMPTIVTDIVNEMFRSQKRKQGFAQKLKEIPVASESEVSDAESLGSQSTISRSSVSSSLASSAASPSNRTTASFKEEYFMWGTELSRSRDATELMMDEVDGEERHMVLFKQAVLGVNAIKDERNLVEIHTTDFEDKEQRHPLVSLTLGQQDFANLDLRLNWGRTKAIKLKLVLGSGPIAITGNHFVEYMDVLKEDEDPDYMATDTEDETDTHLSTMEDDDDEVDDQVAVFSSKTMNGEDTKRKRPLNEDKQSPTKKKAKDGKEKA